MGGERVGQQGQGYQIVTDDQEGGPLYAVFDDGRRERAYESSAGPHGAAPFYVPESQVSLYQGKDYANTSDPFAATFSSPVSYSPAVLRRPQQEWWNELGPVLIGGMAAGGAALAGAGAGTAGTTAGTASGLAGASEGIGLG